MTQRKKVEDLCRLLEHAYTAINDLRGEIDQELFERLELLSDGLSIDGREDMYGAVKALREWHVRRREEIVMDEVAFAPR